LLSTWSRVLVLFVVPVHMPRSSSVCSAYSSVFSYLVFFFFFMSILISHRITILLLLLSCRHILLPLSFFNLHCFCWMHAFPTLLLHSVHLSPLCNRSRSDSILLFRLSILHFHVMFSPLSFFFHLFSYFRLYDFCVNSPPIVLFFVVIFWFRELF
jgi:hypothetical protein